MNRRAVGASFEDRAAEYLRELGFTIVTRRWSCRRGEIDVIALEGDVLVFVEVRARLTGGSPELSIDPRKQSRLRAAAKTYLSEVEWGDRPARFDVVAFDPDGLRHHRSALSD